MSADASVQVHIKNIKFPKRNLIFWLILYEFPYQGHGSSLQSLPRAVSKGAAPTLIHSYPIIPTKFPLLSLPSFPSRIPRNEPMLRDRRTDGRLHP